MQFAHNLQYLLKQDFMGILTRNQLSCLLKNKQKNPKPKNKQTKAEKQKQTQRNKQKNLMLKLISIGRLRNSQNQTH